MTHSKRKDEMIHTYPKVKVAAAHVAPIYLDTERTVDKACSLIAEAAGAGAQLIAFLRHSSQHSRFGRQLRHRF
jgi:hypothetical protein